MSETCPICNTEIKNTDTASGGIGASFCNTCGFPYAKITKMLGKKSRDEFKKLVKERRATLISDCQNCFSNSNTFSVNSESAFIVSNDTKGLTLHSNAPFDFDGTGIREVSCYDSHLVILRLDGRVESFDDDDFGQNFVLDFHDIVSVCAAPDCTYVVNSNGKILYKGFSPFDEGKKSRSFERWTDIKYVCCSKFILAGLKKNGFVEAMCDKSENEEARRASEAAKQWDGIVSIDVCRNTIVGLKSNGTIVTTGLAPDDKRNSASSWTGIKSVCLDSKFIYGLSSSGKIMVAGSSASDLDHGRSDVAKFDDAVAIACSDSSVAVLHLNGTVSRAGIIMPAKAAQMTIPMNKYLNSTIMY